MATLSDMGFISRNIKASDPVLNVNSSHKNLIKAVITGGLWPLVAHASLPRNAIKFDKVQAGTVQRENDAKEFKLVDITNQRVFLHPSSVLFSESTWKSPFVTYFRKQATSKVYLRDVTIVS